jgi:hypothetical protein
VDGPPVGTRATAHGREVLIRTPASDLEARRIGDVAVGGDAGREDVGVGRLAEVAPGNQVGAVVGDRRLSWRLAAVEMGNSPSWPPLLSIRSPRMLKLPVLFSDQITRKSLPFEATAGASSRNEMSDT